MANSSSLVKAMDSKGSLQTLPTMATQSNLLASNMASAQRIQTGLV